MRADEALRLARLVDDPRATRDRTRSRLITGQDPGLIEQRSLWVEELTALATD